jgi:HD-like signal output (HDOD) protein
MMSHADGGVVRPGTPRGADDYVRTVVLTELLADHLPRLPWYLRDLQCALEGCSTDLQRVCTALRASPTICENFIRIGSMAEPAEPICLPVDHLVVLLGKQRVWTVAIAAFLLTEIDSRWSSAAKKEVANLALKRANHAVAAAKAADDETPDQAYVAGILSVAGLLPLVEASGVADHAPEWIEVAAEAVTKQRELFGTDFLEIDRWIRVIWRLPLDMPYAFTDRLPSPPRAKERSSVVPPQAFDQEARNLVLVSRGRL